MKYNPKFLIKINKIAIYYFYLNNLALEGKKRWVRKQYNQRLISSARTLNDLEKKSLNSFTKTILSLEENQIPLHLADVFFNPSPWKILRLRTNSSQYENIRQAFLIFKKKWMNFWKTELVLEAKKGKIALELNFKSQQQFIKKTIKHASILYGIPNLPKTIPIFLIPLPSDIMCGGGKYIPSANGISIEASSKRASYQRTIEIILHELIHLFFENDRFWKSIYKAEQQISTPLKNKIVKVFNLPSMQFGIKEIIATSITIKPLPMQKEESAYQKLLRYTSEQLQPLIVKYHKEEKQIDEIFINKVISLWIKNYEKIR